MILKREEGKGKERLRERECAISPLYTVLSVLTSYRTQNIFGARAMLRLTKPPSQARVYGFISSVGNETSIYFNSVMQKYTCFKSVPYPILVGCW